MEQHRIQPAIIHAQQSQNSKVQHTCQHHQLMTCWMHCQLNQSSLVSLHRVQCSNSTRRELSTVISVDTPLIILCCSLVGVSKTVWNIGHSRTHGAGKVNMWLSLSLSLSLSLCVIVCLSDICLSVTVVFILAWLPSIMIMIVAAYWFIYFILFYFYKFIYLFIYLFIYFLCCVARGVRQERWRLLVVRTSAAWSRSRRTQSPLKLN